MVTAKTATMAPRALLLAGKFTERLDRAALLLFNKLLSLALSGFVAEVQRMLPPANPADVGSIDAIIRALYDGISGPAGKERDWERERSLYLPGARLIPITLKPGT